MASFVDFPKYIFMQLEGKRSLLPRLAIIMLTYFKTWCSFQWEWTDFTVGCAYWSQCK